MRKNLFSNIQTKSLRYQLLIRFSILFFSLLIILEIFQYVYMSRSLFKSRQLLLESRLHNIDRNHLNAIDTEEAVRKNYSTIIKSMSDRSVDIAVIAADGSIIGTTFRSDISVSIPELSKEEYSSLVQQKGDIKKYKIIDDANGTENMVLWSKLGNINTSSGLVQLSTSVEDIRSLLKKQLYIYITISLVILIIGMILGRKVLKHTLNPLYSMTSTIEQINVSQLNTRLPLYGKQYEIDSLSKSFNDMLQRIELSFEKEQAAKEKMRNFISDASHELRTPLTSIHGFVEVLLRGAAKNENQLNLALNNILTESERLTKLVNDLLLLTKLDQQVAVEMKEEDLGEVIKEMYSQLQMIAGERKINLSLQTKLMSIINRDQLKQVVFNLVQNAVQHTDEKEGIINITLIQQSRKNEVFAGLTISDNGTGIRKEHLGEIFGRFFRSESHRSRKYGGYGLGLSIVKSIIDAHKGYIEVNSSLGKGTEFTIFLRISSSTETL